MKMHTSFLSSRLNLVLDSKHLNSACVLENSSWAIGAWFALNILPQSFFSVWNLYIVAGGNSKRLLVFIGHYPQLVCCPVFSFFTYGSTSSGDWCLR